MKKSCDTCAFFGTMNYPCSNCVDYSKWVPLSENGVDISDKTSTKSSPKACLEKVEEFSEGTSPFTEDAQERKKHPVFSGFIKYFPRAIAKVSRISWEGNEQHHPGTPLHWDKSKSSDELDAMIRHLIDSELSPDSRIEELAKVAWRAMANLERELGNA